MHDTEKGQDHLLDLQNFLFDFSAALLQSGAPVHKTENATQEVAEAFHMEAVVIVFPGLIIASFGKMPRTQTTARRVRPGLHCARLALLDDLASAIKAKEMGFEESKERLQKIIDRPPFYPEWVKVACLSLSSAFIAPMFFGGGWRDMLVSGVFGIIVGLLGLLSKYFTPLARLYEPVCALVVSFLARVLAAYLPGLCKNAINFGAICWLLPGLSITTAMIEMASGQVVSGTTRVFFAFLIAIELGFGIAIGNRIPWFTPTREDSCTALDVRFNAVFFPLTVICWNVLMAANPWQHISMSVCAAAGFVVNWAMTSKWGVSPDVTAATAAFAVATMGNLWASFTGHTALVPILGGILILVPGSLGVRGVLGFLSGSSDAGLSFAVQMIIVALSIAVGVFVGQLVEIPRLFLLKKHTRKHNLAL